MKIEHVAIWVKDLERMRSFYEHYFGAVSNDKYLNEKKGFSSYFLSFKGGPRIELMKREDIRVSTAEKLGWAHIALSLGSRQSVDELTSKLRADGYVICGEPRITGDGYYESVIEDPEGNKLELTI